MIHGWQMVSPLSEEVQAQAADPPTSEHKAKEAAAVPEEVQIAEQTAAPLSEEVQAQEESATPGSDRSLVADPMAVSAPTSQEVQATEWGSVIRKGAEEE